MGRKFWQKLVVKYLIDNILVHVEIILLLLNEIDVVVVVVIVVVV